MNYFSGQELLTSSGQTVLANHALGGKSVLALYFSAHWCPPCRQFTPVLREAFRNSGTQKTGVVFVSSDRSPQDQLDYMRSDHGPWPAVRQGSSLAQ